MATPMTRPVELDTAQRLQHERWNELESHLTTWYDSPDLEAIRIAMSSCMAHYCEATDPVSLMLVGVSGSGKTSQIVHAVDHLPHAHVESDVSVPGLLPGRAPGAKRGVKGLLDQIGGTDPAKPPGSGIIVLKDFTSFLSMRDERRKELGAAIREIADGAWKRRLGTEDHPRTWRGKVTWVCCSTYAVERAWAVMRDLGERFMIVKWRHGSPLEAARMAQAQFGRERPNEARTTELAKNFFDFEHRPPFATLPTLEQTDTLAKLAQCVAILRTDVHQDTLNDTLDVPHPEHPTRIAKALQTIAVAHATLWRRPAVTTDDLCLALRVARDTIPEARWRIISNLKPGSTVFASDIYRATNRQMSYSSITYHGNALEVLGVIQRSGAIEEQVEYRFTDAFEALALEAALI